MKLEMSAATKTAQRTLYREQNDNSIMILIIVHGQSHYLFYLVVVVGLVVEVLEEASAVGASAVGASAVGVLAAEVLAAVEVSAALVDVQEDSEEAEEVEDNLDKFHITDVHNNYTLIYAVPILHT